jgi:trehalose 6-phosphate synthase/phosphatase
MRLLLVSNRLPVTSIPTKEGYTFQPSPGGVATGLKSYLENIQAAPIASEYVWIGWPGITAVPEAQAQIKRELNERHRAHPVFFSETEMDNFYHGFCNRTIWALFHYFPGYTIYKEDYWQNYREVNERFCRAVLEIVRPDDIIWIHDYHLMLLPQMLHRELPNNRIGFFLHIPFPSYEVFRLLPSKWRNQILEGLLGADLIGFHTHDYALYFLRCIQRILGKEHLLGHIFSEDRVVKVEAFPMGIDFNKFHQAALNLPAQTELKKTLSCTQIILSIDRLDYSKGIGHRLRAYRYFLEKYPEWRKKIVLLLIVVPSRVGVQQYQLMKREIDELVGSINGRFADITWTPIIYQFRALPFEELVALYRFSDVMLVTPLRDGMNLIAKEYVASKPDQTGVLILSEMAGASKELGEAIIINPNTPEEIAGALLDALRMPLEDQKPGNAKMQRRLKRYDVQRWAADFLETLTRFEEEQRRYEAKLLPDSAVNELRSRYERSTKRLLLLDYDGTLVPFAAQPKMARPDQELSDLFNSLTEQNEVVLFAGRDRANLENWFPNPRLNLVAENGIWIRPAGEEWATINPHGTPWKETILNLMESFADRLPGAFVEEKEFSLAFHFRQSDPEISSIRVKDLMDNLRNLTANTDVQILQGSKVLEVRNLGNDKGTAGLLFLSRDKYDFILAIGDDRTDENLFSVLPDDAFSIHVGSAASLASYNVRTYRDARRLLANLAQTVLPNVVSSSRES